MGMKSKSGHFPSGNGAGGASKRTGSEKGVSPKVGSDVKRMSQKGQELYNKAEDPGLKNQIKELYRPGAVVGDGGTADALREENKTGKKVGGKSHATKARERLRALQKISLKRGLSDSDKSITNDLINDLEDALKGSKK